MIRDVEIIKPSVNVDGIKKELATIIEKYKLEGYKQISLQSTMENADPQTEWDVGTGSALNLKTKEQNFKYLLFPEAKLINHYIEEFGMFRTRVMKLPPSKVMSIHKDKTPRIHIPISTNDACRMMIGNQCYHLETGKIYWTDTRLEHTAFNSSNDPRIHIVGCVMEE